jgi:hypothetical protein
VRLLDQLLMAGDKVLRRWGRVLPGKANVVDAFKHDDVRDTRLRQRVVLEAGQGVDALSNGTDINARRHSGFAQNPIAGDSGIEDGQFQSLPQQPSGEMIRPAIIGVGARARPVGDRIAKSNDRTNRIRRYHLDARQQEPILNFYGIWQCCLADVISCFGDVVGLEGAVMHTNHRGPAGVARQIEVDGKIGHCRYGQIHRIAIHSGARRDGHGRPAAEGEGAARRPLD